MKPIYKKNELIGYDNNSIKVHGHIADPENWHLTIRPLQIFGITLCKKTCTQQEVARYIHLELTKRLNALNEIIKLNIDYTSNSLETITNT